MNLTVSPINFNGKWESVYADKVVKEGYSKFILKRIYHPFENETESEIKRALDCYSSGWTYGIWRLHPNGGQRNKGSISELYTASLGERIPADAYDEYTEHTTRLEIDNVNIDKQEFINNRFNDHFRISDVRKLDKNEVKYLVCQYFE